MKGRRAGPTFVLLAALAVAFGITIPLAGPTTAVSLNQRPHGTAALNPREPSQLARNKKAGSTKVTSSARLVSLDSLSAGAKSITSTGDSSARS